MRTSILFLCVVALAAASVSLVGCGTGTSGASTGQDEGTDSAVSAAADQHVETDGCSCCDHPTEGPHGGQLIELGNEEYHAELLLDDATGTITIHLLDAAGKLPVAIAEPEVALQLFRDGQFVSYVLKAASEPTNVEYGASRFQLADADLCETLCHGEEINGRLQVTVDGKPYTGTIQGCGHADGEHEGHAHDADGHEGHDHDADDHDADDHAGHDHDADDHAGHDH